jgi:hypothetical protein
MEALSAATSDPGGVLHTRHSAPRTAAFRRLQTVGFPLDPALRDILLSTTIPISGLHHAACLLATPGFVRPLAGRHAGSLLTGWLGVSQVGLEPEVLTYWVTTTNFIGFLLLPRFRAYLGASKRWLGAVGDSTPPLGSPVHPPALPAWHGVATAAPAPGALASLDGCDEAVEVDPQIITDDLRGVPARRHRHTRSRMAASTTQVDIGHR